MADKKKNPMVTAGAAMRTAAGAVMRTAAAGSAMTAAAGSAALKKTDLLYAERVRQLFKKNDDIRDKGLEVPKDLVRLTDLKYGTDPAQVLDIYYPAGAEGPLPTIISVHGGGFVYGDKERYQFYCMSLAQRGFAVVNFTYRLAPEWRFPAQLEDTNLVMRYISGTDRDETAPENINENDTVRSKIPRIIDLGNLFMVGDSAGAQLAAQYCAALSNPAYARLLELELPQLSVRACALNCGLYMFDPKKDRMMARCYFGGSAGKYTDKMNLFGNVTKDFPPAFIMTSTGDFLQARAEPFAVLLTRLGVENELHVYGDDEDRPGHVFHCNMRDPMGKRCNDDECGFFRKHII